MEKIEQMVWDKIGGCFWAIRPMLKNTIISGVAGGGFNVLGKQIWKGGVFSEAFYVFHCQ